MKVLVIGGGGREHAIVWKLRQSPKVTDLYCAPGNAGTGEIAVNVPIAATDIAGLVSFALSEKIDVTVVGPDDPLVMGAVDAFEEAGLLVFGPRKSAARMEGSKAYAKEFMKKYHIPTADYEIYYDSQQCIEALRKKKYPLAIKVDGLALGKGVVLCASFDEAEKAIQEMMIERKFGDAGNRVVIEEYLYGPEVSVLAFTDGEHIIPMEGVQDHKRIYDADKGPNTGGMGTLTPSPHYDASLAQQAMETILKPTIVGLQKEGTPFVGVLFFGLMLTADGPKVIEYNCRFGDPETQVLLPRLRTDLMEIILACVNNRLRDLRIEWDDRAAACVIAASGGYPLEYETGYEISGLRQAGETPGAIVFHAGTKREGDKIVTAGGRVLGVTGLGSDLQEAVRTAYAGAEQVSFQDMHYRRDIGIK